MVKILLGLGHKYFNSYRGLSFQCWQRLLLTFFVSLATGVIFFLTIYFVHDLHLNVAVAGFIMSFYGIGNVVGGLLGGKLSDHFKPVYVAILALCILAVAYISLINLTHANMLAICLFVIGVSYYSFITANTLNILSCVSDDDNHRKALSIYSAISNLSGVISAVVISCFVHLGYQVIFSASSILLIAATIYLIFLERRCTPVSEQQNKPKTQRNSAANISAKKHLIFILVCVFLTGLVVSQLFATYPLFVREHYPALGTKGVGILFAINSGLVVLLEVPVAQAMGHFGKFWIMGFSSLLMGFGMFLLIFAHSFGFAVFASIIYTLGEIPFFPVAQLLCYQAGGQAKKGTKLGLFRTAYALSLVTGPAIGGMIYHHLGGNGVWYFTGIIGLTCLGLCAYLQQRLRSV